MSLLYPKLLQYYVANIEKYRVCEIQYKTIETVRMESFYQKKTIETRNKHRIFSQLSFSLPHFGLLVKAMPK